MRQVRRVAELSEALGRARRGGQRVGLVTTMGAFHDGHRSLISRAVSECDTVCVSIFVNPLQFGEAADLEAYPRTLEPDLEACRGAGVALALTPTVQEMYPHWPGPTATSVSVAGLSTTLEGASRPGHFDGVATVVAKLFAMTGECRAYFGEKDLQQLLVVRTMASDLSFPVEVVGCPTVREQDGLAMSSRNVRMSQAERAAAPVLARALVAGSRAVQGGERRSDAVADEMTAVISSEPLARLEYAVVAEATDLSAPRDLAGRGPGDIRLLVAARVGPVRLIDNCDPLDTGASEHLRAAVQGTLCTEGVHEHVRDPAVTRDRART